ncbi:hypothetical protein HZ326_27377 [Fusarium oxysporum f. sp. albedinis]|nr:hypothetical protein HZ326_27377 [Fusarium oxysporum f. sp. albedinis]
MSYRFIFSNLRLLYIYVTIDTMDAPSTQKPSSPKMSFEDLMRESIRAIEILPTTPDESKRTENRSRGIHALWHDSMLDNGEEHSKYHSSLRQLHELGLLIVSFSRFLEGDHETLGGPNSRFDFEARTIPMVYFLMPRGERSDMFIEKLMSNTELAVCIWDAKDEFAAGVDRSSEELSNKNVKGMNFECRIERSWNHHPSWIRSVVVPFEYCPEIDDETVKRFLENDNPYFCVVGMKINWNDYLERSPRRFLEKIKGFDLLKHIEQAKKLSVDGLAGAYTQLNDKKVEELSGLPSKEEAKKSSEDGLAGAHEEVNHEKDDCGNYRKSFEELSGLPSKGEAKKPSQDGLAGAYKQMNHKDHYPTPFEELSGLQNKIEAKKRRKVSR